MIVIRNETEEDYRAVEEMLKRAFWNVNHPGADEHYLAHVIRPHPDFVPELDLVGEVDGKIIASIMYTRCALVDEEGNRKTVLSFGPLGVDPDYTRQGYGKQLLLASMEKAAELGYEVIANFGNPENYVTSGMKNCRKMGVYIGDHVYPVPLLVKELKPGALEGKLWRYEESHAYKLASTGFEEFDKDFPQMEPGYAYTQELFDIYSHATVNW